MSRERTEQPRRVYVVEERPNPSSDYFVLPALAARKTDAEGAAEPPRLQRLGFQQVPPINDLQGAEVIFVRYLPPAWVRALNRPEAQPHRIVVFIDDDVFSLRATRGTPWRYRWKLYWLSQRRIRWLRKKGAELWVGSEVLRDRYQVWRPRLLRPIASQPCCQIKPQPWADQQTASHLIEGTRGIGASTHLAPAAIAPRSGPPAELGSRPNPVISAEIGLYADTGGFKPGAREIGSAAANPVANSEPPGRTGPITALTCLFYHASASHQREHAWVFALMQQLLLTHPRMCFEVIADGQSARRYRALPRTCVIPPMDWPTYRAFLQVPGRHIGLAPLLPSAFNRARCYTKFFEITSAGAVGLYSATPPFASIIEHQVSGLLLSTRLDDWAKALSGLAQDHHRIRQMHARAAARIADQHSLDRAAEHA